MSAPPPPLSQVGPFQFLEGPFEGSFGQVWRVFDRDSGDEFALKSLKGEAHWPAERLAAFQREIGLWIGLPVHPNVVRALRAFEHAGRPFVLLEWVPGGTLRQWLDRLPRMARPPPARQLADTLECLRQLAEGVAHLHDHGLVHGDLKPANVMMWSGSSPQVSDFGFARAAGDSAAVRGGTRSYMAPELALGAPTPASDLFAVGTLFREVLLARCGEEAGADALALADAMCSPQPADRPPSLHTVAGTLAALVERTGWPPSVRQRTGPRLTWSEEHAKHVLPHRERYEQAMTELAAGHAARAREALEALLGERPAMLDARLALIALKMREGDVGAARELVLAAPPPDLRDTSRVLQLAQKSIGVGCIAQATALIEPLFADEQLRFEVWRLRGHVAWVERRIGDAVDCLQQALALREDPRTRFELAGLLRKAGLLDQALEAYAQAGAGDPGLAVKAAQGAARIMADRGEHDAALNALHVLLRRPLDAAQQSALYTEMGHVYALQPLPEAAARAYRKALALDRANRAASEGLQRALAQGDRH